MALSYDVCVYILYDHPAISFGDRTGQFLQRPCGDRTETAQSSCNFHDRGIKIARRVYDAPVGSLRLSKESKRSSFWPKMTI